MTDSVNRRALTDAAGLVSDCGIAVGFWSLLIGVGFGLGSLLAVMPSLELGLKIVEVPIRYACRTYGETQISRFVDGWLLLRMVVFAWRKLKTI